MSTKEGEKTVPRVIVKEGKDDEEPNGTLLQRIFIH